MLFVGDASFLVKSHFWPLRNSHRLQPGQIHMTQMGKASGHQEEGEEDWEEEPMGARTRGHYKLSCKKVKKKETKQEK